MFPLTDGEKRSGLPQVSAVKGKAMVESKSLETKYAIFPVFLKIFFESNCIDQLIRLCAERLSQVFVERETIWPVPAKGEPIPGTKFFVGWLVW